MKRHSLIFPVGAAVLLACAQVASAHPGHGTTTGFAAGVQHPLTGADHILAMIAVGICAARIGGRALWILPATFLSFMAAGGLLAGGATGTPPAVDQAIAASVLVFGLMVAAGSRVMMPITFALVGLFAMFHGYAHGAEMRAGLAPAAYGLGFILATAALLVVGLTVGVAIQRSGRALIRQIAGGAIAASGLFMLCMLIL